MLEPDFPDAVFGLDCLDRILGLRNDEKQLIQASVVLIGEHPTRKEQSQADE
jgi:hypothetical protein